MKKYFAYFLMTMLLAAVGCEREQSDGSSETPGVSFRECQVKVGSSAGEAPDTKTVFDVSSDGLYDLHLFAFYAETKTVGGKSYKEGDLVVYPSSAGDLEGGSSSRVFYSDKGGVTVRDKIPFNWALPTGIAIRIYTVANANQTSDPKKILSAQTALAAALDEMAGDASLTESEFLSSELFTARYDDVDEFFEVAANAGLENAPLIKTGKQQLTLTNDQTNTITLRVFRLLSRYNISLGAGVNTAAAAAQRGYWMSLANASVMNMNKNVPFFLTSMPNTGITQDVSGTQFCYGDYSSDEEVEAFNGGQPVTFFVTPNDQQIHSNDQPWYNQQAYWTGEGGQAFIGNSTYVNLTFNLYRDEGFTSYSQAVSQGELIRQVDYRLYLGSEDNADSSPDPSNFRLYRNLSRDIVLDSFPAEEQERPDEKCISWIDESDIPVKYTTGGTSTSSVSPRAANVNVMSESTVYIYSEEEFTSEECVYNNVGKVVNWEIVQADKHYVKGTIKPESPTLQEVTFVRSRPYFRHLRPRKIDYEEIRVDVPSELYMGQRKLARAGIGESYTGLDASKGTWQVIDKAAYLDLGENGLSIGAATSTWDYSDDFDLTSLNGADRCAVNAKLPHSYMVRFKYYIKDDDGYGDKCVFSNDYPVTVKAPTLIAINNENYQFGEPYHDTGTGQIEYVVESPLTDALFDIRYCYIDDDGNLLFSFNDLFYNYYNLRHRQYYNYHPVTEDFPDLLFLCSLRMNNNVALSFETGSSNFTKGASGNTGFIDYNITRPYGYRFTPSSQSVFDNAVSTARKTTVRDFDIHGSPCSIRLSCNNTYVNTRPSYVSFVIPTVGDSEVELSNDTNIVGLGNTSGMGQDSYSFPASAHINDSYHTRGVIDGVHFPGLGIELSYEVASGIASAGILPNVDAVFNGLVIDYGLKTASSAYRPHVTGKATVNLVVTNGSYTSSVKYPLFSFYRGIRVYWGAVATGMDIRSGNRLTGIQYRVSSKFYSSANSTVAGSIDALSNVSRNSLFNVVDPSLSNTYVSFDSSNPIEYGVRAHGQLYDFLMRGPANSPSLWNGYACNNTSSYVAAPNYFYKYFSSGVRLNGGEDVSRFFNSETRSFYDKMEDSGLPAGWPRLVFISQQKQKVWSASEASVPETNDYYLVDVYYDNFYSKKEWNDLSSWEQAGLGVWFFHDPALSLITGYFIYKDWWIRRDQIAFGMTLSSVNDTSDGYTIPSANTSDFNVLKQYIQGVEVYTDPSRTSTYMLDFSNDLDSYSFTWGSNEQEWAESNSVSAVYYGDEESTRLLPYFFDDEMNYLPLMAASNNSTSVGFSQGMRIKTGMSGAMNIPIMRGIDRRGVTQREFIPFYGIKDVIMKDSYINYNLNENWGTAKRKVVIQEHFEPKYAKRNESEDWE